MVRKCQSSRRRGLRRPEPGQLGLGLRRAAQLVIHDQLEGALGLVQPTGVLVNLAQLQAMAYGLPSLKFALGELGYRGPGLEEACIELPPGNVAAVAQALIRLSECPGRCRELGTAAQAYARHYDSLSAVKTYEKTYDRFCRQ